MSSDVNNNNDNKNGKIYIYPDSFYKPPILGFIIGVVIYTVAMVGASVFLKCHFLNHLAHVFIISFSIIIITTIICFTIFSIKMLGHIIKLKKMKVISEIRTIANEDARATLLKDNLKTFVNAITDL